MKNRNTPWLGVVGLLAISLSGIWVIIHSATGPDATSTFGVAIIIALMGIGYLLYAILEVLLRE